MGRDKQSEAGGSTDGRDQIEEAFALVSRPGFNRGQTLRTAVNLGVIDAIAGGATSAAVLADDLDLDSENTYRLLRALAFWGVAEENESGEFSLTGPGEYFRTDHPRSLSSIAQLWWHPDRMAAWGHLEDVVREGGPTGYEREFDRTLWEQRERNAELEAAFDGAMTTFSQLAAPGILEALAADEFDGVSTVCDVGGGHGYLISRLLETYDHLEGTVLELPEVVAEEDRLWAPELGVGDRCSYVAGDMFEEVPRADAYVMKNVLHDWSDEDCIAILSTIQRDSPDDVRLFIVERLLPPPGETNPAIMSDINMMVAAGGRERTRAAFRELLEAADWRLVGTRSPEASRYSVIEATTT